MFNTLKVTFKHQQPVECMNESNGRTDIRENFATDSNVAVIEDFEEALSRNSDYNENANNKISNDSTQNGNSNKDLIKQEIECSSIKNNEESNNDENNINTLLGQNDTLSYLNEFSLFLKNYENHSDNGKNFSIDKPLMPVVSEMEAFMKDGDEKLENVNQLNVSNLCENSKILSQNISEADDIIRYVFTEDCSEPNCKVNTHDSETQIVKPNNDNELDYSIEVKSNIFSEFFDTLNYVIEKDVANTDETDNIVSIDSESSNLSIDKIQIDPSANYSVQNSMKINFIDELDTDSECEGYNSSDFEFIDEEEAQLGHILNKSKRTKSKEYIEHSKNVNEPGPSGIAYKRSEVSTAIVNLDGDRDSDVEDTNDDYIIPEGEQFYELFAEPSTSYSYELENKSFFSNRAMNFDVDNIGFNVGILHQLHQEEEVDDAVKQEAIENARKICLMYPADNKRRRRF